MRKLNLALALVMVVVLFVMSSPSADAWVDTDYDYRAPINLTVNENVSENYVFRLELDNQDNLDNHLALENWDDILFTENEDAEPLSFWIENWNAGDNCVVWVRRDDNSLSDNTIYIYYGNSSATNLESGENTFTLLFDDFEDNDTSDWTAEAGTSMAIETTTVYAGDYSGDATISTAWNSVYKSHTSTSANLMMHFWYNTPDTVQTSSAPTALGGAFVNSYYFETIGADFGYYDTSFHAIRTYSINTWYEIDLELRPSTGKWDIWFDQYENVTGADERGTANPLVAFDISGNTNADAYYDDMYLRPYTTPEPTASLGSEESLALIAVQAATVDNALIDRKQDVTGSSAVLATQISVRVSQNSAGENADSLTDNIHIWVYDAGANLVVTAATPTDNTLIDENTIEFHFATYNPSDAMVDASLGYFRVYAEATDNNGSFDNSNNTTAFVVDDGDAVLTQENQPGHRHRVYATATRVSGGATTLNDAERVDMVDGRADAEISGNAFENTYAPTSTGYVWFEIELNTVLDGVSDNLHYAYPNIAPQIISITADNTLIDRDQDYANSTAVTGTTITAQVSDLDGYADIIDAWIAVRDNADVMRDNENVYSTATVVDENTYSFTLAFDPLDSLPNSSLGNWDVDVLTADNYGSTHNNWGIPAQVENFEDTAGWVYYETGFVTRVDHEQSTAFIKEGTYSHRIWTDEAGADVSNGYYRRAAAIDFTELSEILFWTQRSTKPPDSAVYFFISPDNSAFSILWRIWDITENVADEVVMDVSGYEGEYFVMFGVLGKGVNHSTDYYFDDLRLRGYGDNVFKVDDLNVPVNYPENIYVGWNTTVSGTITRLTGDNASVDNVRIVDDVEGTFNLGAGNSYSQTYLIDGSMFSDNVGVTVSVCDGPLDGETITSYLVSDNALYEITIRWEDNYGVVSWVPDANRPLELTFQWNGGSENYTMTSNPENVSVDSSGIAMTWVRVNDNDVYWRKIIPEFSGGQITLVIVDDFTTVDQYQFFLQDYTAFYIPPDGQLIIRKWIGTTLAEINGEYWGADWRCAVWLITGEEYQVWVQGVDAPLRLIGPLTAFSPSEEKTIIVRVVEPEMDAIYDHIAWGAWRDNAGVVRVEYQDNLDNTVTAHVGIYNMAGTLVAEYQPDNEWFIITYTMGDNSLSYVAELTVNHNNYGTIYANMPVRSMLEIDGVGGGASNPWDLPDGLTLSALAAIIATTVIGLAFDAARAQFGVMAIALSMAFFWYAGFLPLPGPADGAYTATLFIVMATLFALTWRGGK